MVSKGHLLEAFFVDDGKDDAIYDIL